MLLKESKFVPIRSRLLNLYVNRHELKNLHIDFICVKCNNFLLRIFFAKQQLKLNSKLDSTLIFTNVDNEGGSTNAKNFGQNFLCI